jgi:glycerate 2-kinase
VLGRLDAYHRIKGITRLDGDLLTIGTRTWDLSTKRNVYLVGAGKACNHMAMAVEETLGDRLTRGIAIVKVAEESDRFQPDRRTCRRSPGTRRGRLPRLRGDPGARRLRRP